MFVGTDGRDFDMFGVGKVCFVHMLCWTGKEYMSWVGKLCFVGMMCSVDKLCCVDMLSLLYCLIDFDWRHTTQIFAWPL